MITSMNVCREHYMDAVICWRQWASLTTDEGGPGPEGREQKARIVLARRSSPANCTRVSYRLYHITYLVYDISYRLVWMLDIGNERVEPPMSFVCKVMGYGKVRLHLKYLYDRVSRTSYHRWSGQLLGVLGIVDHW